MALGCLSGSWDELGSRDVAVWPALPRTDICLCKQMSRSHAPKRRTPARAPSPRQDAASSVHGTSSRQLLLAGPVAQTHAPLPPRLPLPPSLRENVSNFHSGRLGWGLSFTAGEFCVITNNVKLQPRVTGILKYNPGPLSGIWVECVLLIFCVFLLDLLGVTLGN